MSDLPDFDTLMKLAKEQPEALEALRQKHVEQIITKAPEAYQARLRGLQFQIDAQRQIHKDSPMGSCMKISKMMHESFGELRTWLNNITGANDPLRNECDQLQDDTDNKVDAKVLSFPVA